jgi:hypothetical protein
LYKTVPELFFGIFLVLLYLLEWAHAAFQRSRQNLAAPNPGAHQKALKNMNFRRQY